MKKDINKNQEHRVILNNFLNAISNYICNKVILNSIRRECTRSCFKYIFNDDKKALVAINKYLRVDSWAEYNHYNSSIYNVYDVCNMTMLQSYEHTDILTVKRHFYKNVINLHLNDSYYFKMQKFTKNFNNSVNKVPFARTFLKKQRKCKHYIGIAIMLATLIITILIPNHAINMTGLTVGNFLFVIFHFLVLQFSNLINVASIGRLMINAIVDIPVIKHYFLD